MFYKKVRLRKLEIQEIFKKILWSAFLGTFFPQTLLMIDSCEIGHFHLQCKFRHLSSGRDSVMEQLTVHHINKTKLDFHISLRIMSIIELHDFFPLRN